MCLFTAGCSTPGPLHAYVANRAEQPVVDLFPGDADIAIPTYLEPVNDLYGIAYDPFTDHLFLRIYPGDFVRVIDRPARKIKRNFLVQDLPPGRGDLAIRSHDRHLFFAHPSLPKIVESNLEGRRVHTITLENLQGPPSGVAYDQINNRLLILHGDNPACIATYDLAGLRQGDIALDRQVRLTSLAYDSDTREFYVPLKDGTTIGIFNIQGHFLRSIASSPATPHDFIDVGQRSLLRLF
ncbi:MAG: hypothetical protein WC205_02050 [Opitutaceae bacterium]